MGKAATRKMPFAASKAARASKDNPFEAQPTKRKFIVMGRHSYGANKNLNQARSEAVGRVRCFPWARSCLVEPACASHVKRAACMLFA